ncbi:MAG TPA: hypothetical protein VHD62_00645 [Opitutaceae bacterium]|nr:hypothetical protein [Opitutaceae bacterium]
MSYEKQDASLRLVAITTALLVFGVVASLGVSAWWYDARYGGSDAVPADFRQTSFTHGAEAQPDIVQSAREVEVTARERLENYEWVDRAQGVARIPIERAMDLVAHGAKPVPSPKEPGQVP